MITATYSGSAGFGPSSGTVTQRLDNASVLTFTAPNLFQYCNPGSITIPLGGVASPIAGAPKPYQSKIFTNGLPGQTRWILRQWWRTQPERLLISFRAQARSVRFPDLIWYLMTPPRVRWGVCCLPVRSSQPAPAPQILIQPRHRLAFSTQHRRRRYTGSVQRHCQSGNLEFMGKYLDQWRHWNDQ
jgi:hypothetical protein